MNSQVFTAGLCTVLLSACTAAGSGTVSAQPAESVPISETQLAGTWQLTAVRQNGQAAGTGSGSDGQALTVRFDPQTHRLEILNGCNRLSAPYRIENGRLNTGLMLSTRKMCEPGLMHLDQLAAAAFQTDNTFRLEAGTTPDTLLLNAERSDSTYRFRKIRP